MGKQVCCIIVLLFLSGCSTPEQWVQREDLRESNTPSIESIILTNGTRIDFDEERGWYDANKSVIVGRPILGTRSESFQVSEVQSARIASHLNSLATIGLTVAILTPFVILALIAHWIGQGGG